MDTARTLATWAGRDPRSALAALLGAALLFLTPTLPAFHVLWREQPYTHGYLIAGATLWLLYRERAHLVPSTDQARVAILLALGASALWTVGWIANIRVAMQLAVPILLLCWTAAVLGVRTARRLAPIAAVFALAIPVWDGLTYPLRIVTVVVTEQLLGLVGIPATIDGTTVHLAYGTFAIEDACAGFSYFMAGTSIGAIYSMSFLETTSARVKLVLAAIGVSIAANWLRVTSLIVIGHVTRMGAPVLADHGPYGWVIFSVAILTLLAVSEMRIRRRARAASTAGPGVEAGTSDAPSETEAPDASSAERAAPPQVTVRLAVAASAAMAAGPALALVIAWLPNQPVRTAEVSPPAGWIEAAVEPDSEGWTPAFVGADEHRSTLWSSGPDAVRLDRLLYHSQRQGAELIGYPNRIADADATLAERLIGPVGPERRVLNEAIVREENGVRLVWYWYTVGGVRTASGIRAKLLELPAFFRRREAAALFALSAPCDTGSCEHAADALARFLAAAP